MSVKIEILDYQYGIGGNIVDFSTGTAQTGWSISSINNQRANWSGDGTGNTKYYEYVSETLVAGVAYNIKIFITNYNGNGNIGISASTSGGTANGIGTTFMDSGNAAIEGDVTITTTGKLRVFGKGTNRGTVEVRVKRLDGVVWEDSIVGELDATSHEDFPLALTFQISDIKDITSTSGDYSKTFKIPATKNNNKILKHQFTANSEYSGQHISIMRDCRILVNDFYSLVGKIKVTAINGYGDRPSSYDCIFYGNNLGWAKELEGKYMDETFADGHGLWGSAGSQLEYNKAKIIETWNDANCDSSSRPFVYPIVSYGDNNPDGEPNTIQLLDTAYDFNQTGSTNKKGYNGYFDSGASYGTPLPSADWRPAIFVKTTIYAIFSKLGYSVSSSFMETDMFKKLVWLLPNFRYNNTEERIRDYSLEYKFVSERSKTLDADSGIPAIDVPNFFTNYEDGAIKQSDADTHYDGDNRLVVGLANAASPFDTGYNIETVLDDETRIDLTDPNYYITIGEYGYYDITLPSFQVQVTRCYKGGTQTESVYDIDTCINLELNTVGQSSSTKDNWHIIGRIEKSLHPHTSTTGSGHGVNQNNYSFTSFQNTTNLVLNKYWLNKGDRLRLSRGIRLADTSEVGQAFKVDVMWKTHGGSRFTISFSPENVEYGQIYDLSQVMNKQYKQLDFIKGVSHAFNLTLTTNEVTKTINIEPFNDFYKTYGFAIDWTHKLDRSKEIKDSWIKSDLKRKVIFKYKSDTKDEKVAARGNKHFDKIHDEYPYWTELSDAFERGESVFENPFFAGTYNAQDSDIGGSLSSQPAFSGCLWQNPDETSNSSRADTPKGNEFLPRLLYWKKYSPASAIDTRMQAIVQTWSGITEKIIPDASTATVENNIISNVFPQATSINRHDVNSPVLSYGNVWINDYNDATGVFASSTTGEGLFETYYRKMFAMMQSSPRVRTVYFDLGLTDIINLDFRKLVYIDGVYWRINRVLDYQPNKNTTTKVELLQWIETGVFAASAPSFGNFSDLNYGVGVYANVSDISEPTDGGNFG